MRGLRLLGARTIYVTHMHDLAARVPELNEGPGVAVGSLVAEAEAADGAPDVPIAGMEELHRSETTGWGRKRRRG